MESNVQKMRKVLEYILHKFYDGADGYPHARLNIRDKGMIKSTLSKPLRNCDVGTAEEQGRRFALFCLSASNCKKCPIHDVQCKTPHRPPCAIRWSQMPYEANTDMEVDKIKKGASDEN